MSDSPSRGIYPFYGFTGPQPSAGVHWIGGIRVTFGLEVVVTTRAWLTGVVAVWRRAGDTFGATVVAGWTITVVA
jgi:hypothetical protein